MRVTLDARMAGLPGIGRFIIGLWRGLAATDADVLGLWPRGELNHWLGPHRPRPPGPYETVRARPFLAAEQVELPLALRRFGSDVHHAAHFNVPYAARVPIVLTVYDLFLYRDPSKARSRAAGAYYRVAVPLAVRRARAVVALSPFTAGQLTETFGLDGDRLRVVEAGLDHDQWHPRPEAAVEAVRSRFGLPGEYLLYVGTAKRHKNLATLLRAHGPAHPALVLAGPTREEVASLDVTPSGRVVMLGRVPDDVLPALYTGALALALPSLYEALGFTALEAMACGTAVIASDGGQLPETVGDAGLLVSPDDVAAWRDALDRIAVDAELRQRLAAAGRARVAGRSWDECARRYRDVYREVAE